MLYVAEFDSGIIKLIFDLANWMLRPFLFAISEVISYFLPTTKELSGHDHVSIYYKRIRVLVYFFLLFIFAPLTFLGAIIKIIVHYFRRPYKYSYYEPLTTKGTYTPNEPSALCVVTANVCLQAEWISRLCNLSHTYIRAHRIGERILADQFFANSGASDSVKYESSSDSESSSAVTPDLTQEGVFEHDILTHFPMVDFLCMQECCDRDCTNLLVDSLHRFYRYIVHDVGMNSFTSNRFAINSGLLFASRFPILDVDFKHFPERNIPCVFMSMGLLMVKVLLGVSGAGYEHVGYIYNTHLQVYKDKSNVSVKQLSNVMQWTSEFAMATHRPNDHVAFDIICGDFNFDNTSPADEKEWSHPLFSRYMDVCREKAGTNNHWTVGTERRFTTFWDSEVSSPEGLKKVLSDPKLRPIYAIDGDLITSTIDMCTATPKRDKHGNIAVTPEAGRRKVDVVLYNKDSPVNVTNYDTVTRLCPLTDHMSVAMTFTPAMEPKATG